MNQEPIVVELPFLGVTRRMVRYESLQPELCPVRSLYIRQDAIKQGADGKWPASVTVTVAVAE